MCFTCNMPQTGCRAIKTLSQRQLRLELPYFSAPHGYHALTVALITLSTPFAALAADPTCVNYYTIGESDCRPAASTPVATPQSESPPRLLTPQQTETEVDKYLANYGKPPREFVEFYLNPTQENATKWVKAYQDLLQKGRTLSEAWTQADAQLKATDPLYQSPVSQAPAAAPSLSAPLNQAAPASNLALPVSPSQARFGAFAGDSTAPTSGAVGVRPKQVKMTYYFSKTCPYCAKMTPELSILSRDMAGKLELTCVDVTPLGPTMRPEPANISAQLNCKWRLPEDGEVERESVRQTPTLVINKEGESPLRFSGYVPLAQLRTHF